MGKTPKPLKILHCYSIDWGEFIDLQMQGHEVKKMLDLSSYDIVLAPNAWLMDEQHRKYLDLAIKSARARRYPKET